MLTPDEAEQRLREYFRDNPPALRGTLYFPGGWSEDDKDYVIGWGAREFEVEGREGFGRWDNLVYFVDKRTGEVRKENFTPNARRIHDMVHHSRRELELE